MCVCKINVLHHQLYLLFHSLEISPHPRDTSQAGDLKLNFQPHSRRCMEKPSLESLSEKTSREPYGHIVNFLASRIYNLTLYNCLFSSPSSLPHFFLEICSKIMLQTANAIQSFVAVKENLPGLLFF